MPSPWWIEFVLTLSGCVNDPALDWARGSHNLTEESQLPVTTTLTSGQYSTHRIGPSWLPITVSENKLQKIIPRWTTYSFLSNKQKYWRWQRERHRKRTTLHPKHYRDWLKSKNISSLQTERWQSEYWKGIHQIWKCYRDWLKNIYFNTNWRIAKMPALVLKNEVK